MERMAAPCCHRCAKALEQHDGNVDPSRPSLGDAQPQTIKIGLVELVEIKFGLTVESITGSGSRVSLRLQLNFIRAVMAPGCLLPNPKANEVQVMLLQEIEIGGKIQRRPITTVNEIVIQVSTAQVDESAARIGKIARLRRIDFERATCCGYRYLDAPSQKDQNQTDSRRVQQ